jgi:hypothetical protein
MSSPLPPYNNMTASASVLSASNTKLKIEYEKWQDELWDYWERLGEYEAGVSWKANSMSRVRLLAAEQQPSGQEPIPIETGPAADAVERLAGGIGGQSQLMGQATIHLSVPGEGWLVGQVDRDGGEPQMGADGQMMPDDELWDVYSADQLRRSRSKDERGNDVFEILTDEGNAWKQIGPDSVVVRFLVPHPRFKFRADSPGRHAMGDLARLDAINKRIISTLWSRLAMNGFLLYDKQRLGMGDKPPPQNGGKATDPFGDLMVGAASKAIRDPLSPESLLPIPVGYNIEDPTDVDPKMLIQLIKTFDGVDPKLIDLQDSAIRKLATTMDMPAEILLGMSGLNHWGAWQIEESGIKIHIAPDAEKICFSLTKGFLVPTLKAGGHELRGPNGGRIIVWYDPSEIVQRPDKSDKAVVLNDRGIINDTATRREGGFDETDAPTQAELDFMIQRRQALAGTSTSPDTVVDDRSLPDTDRDTVEEAEPDEQPPGGQPELSLNGAPR